jgi:predicted transcriptional regulator
MRTSIDLSDDMFRQLKILAANRRVTLKARMQTAIESELIRASSHTRRRLRFPILECLPATLRAIW